MNQLDFIATPSHEMTEKDAFNLIRPALLEVLSDNNVDSKMLSFSRKKDYSSVTFSTYLLCRICIRSGKSHFSVSAEYRTQLPQNADAKVDPKDGKFISIPISPAGKIEEYVAFLSSVLQTLIDRVPKTFDCCSRYLECSDAKRCISPNKTLAMGCGYKKILKSGRIFYGRNCNIKVQ